MGGNRSLAYVSPHTHRQTDLSRPRRPQQPPTTLAPAVQDAKPALEMFVMGLGNETCLQNLIKTFFHKKEQIFLYMTLFVVINESTEEDEEEEGGG